MATKLTEGQAAPGFSLSDQEGKTVKLSEYKDRRVLLYFYPRADSPGCKKQSCSLRDVRMELKSMRVEIVGISPDFQEDQRAFDQKYHLGFTLLCDPGLHVAETYGVVEGKSKLLKSLKGITRSSFLIDENGVLRRAWYKVKPEETVPKAKEAIEELFRAR